MNNQLFSKIKSFRSSHLYKELKRKPLGFVDVGSLGGVHSIVDRIADLVHPFCFEPDPDEYALLKKKYKNPHPYSKITLHKLALAGQIQKNRTLYVSETPTNTSLIEPNTNFIRRYQATRFKLSHTIKIPTTTLDMIFRQNHGYGQTGEFLKLDTQGSEHEILQGAKGILSRPCVAVFCEVEFFQVYKRQKTLEDITIFLRKFGFSLYGLYPHYRSTKLLDRRQFHTEERLMWADAVFFKDPLDDLMHASTFSARSKSVLILCAMALRFYDFALELIQNYVNDNEEHDRLVRTIKTLARADHSRFKLDLKKFRRQLTLSNVGFQLQQFIDEHRSNSSIDHLRS